MDIRESQENPAEASVEMTEGLLDPTYDAGFKLLFGREDVSEDMLKELLNSIFEGDSELADIQSVTYMNSEKEGEYSGARGIRYDILCRTGSGHRFIVEMQKAPQRYFIKRAEYYYSRAIAEQGFSGKGKESATWDYDFTPVVGVYICQTRVKGLPPKLVTRCRLADEESGEPIESTIRYVYVQLPYCKQTEEECISYCDEWMYNIRNMGQKQEVAFKSKRDVFRRLAEISKVSNLSPAQRRVYEADIKAARDYHNELEYARAEGLELGLEEGRRQGLEQGLEQGRRQGLEQGREQGLEQGRAQGLEQGREQGAWKKLCSIVSALRSKGMDTPAIAALIGESPEVIASI